MKLWTVRYQTWERVLEPFNKLTPAQVERLAYLIEECSEVQHMACKILRHGYDTYDPTSKNPTHNRLMLCNELADFHNAVELLLSSKDLYRDEIERCIKPYTGRYMHHQKVNS